MSTVTEIEFRGLLTTEAYQSLQKFFDEKGSFEQKKERVLIDYSTLLASEGVRERTRDIRVRNTNGKSELIVKVGSWGGNEQRLEHSVVTEAPFDTLVQTMSVLGYSKGVLCIRNTMVYTYQDIEFALVEVPGHSYYFEAEITTTDEASIPAAQAKITATLNELHLQAFTDEEFYSYIETLNAEANSVFSASDATTTYFKDTFSI